MNTNISELKAAASKESGVQVTLNKTYLSDQNSIDECTGSANQLSFVSMDHSFFGELESKNAIPAKLVYDNFPQSGNEKSARRLQYLKSKTSKDYNSAKYLAKKLGTTWNPEERKDAMKKANKKFSDRYNPHSGLVSEIFSLDSLKELAQVHNLPISDDIFHQLEGFALLCLALSEAVSATQACSIFLMYLKLHFKDKSLIMTAADSFKSLFESNDIEPHSGVSKPTWLTSLRSALTDWKLLVNNPVFKKISYLMSICVTLGLCDAASFTWNIGGVRAFSLPVLDKHYGAVDLIDAAIETVMYFVEGGYECFVSQSFTPFLFSDLRARELEQDYGFLVSNLEHVKTGNLRKLANCDENEYDRRLNLAISEADELHRCAKGTWEKKLLFDRLAQLRKIKTTFDSTRVQGGLREAPFCVSIFGKSGVGKSSVSAISMVVGLLSNGFAADDEMMATLNESDKYMSNYRSFVNGIFMDDVGNTKADFVEKSPTNKIIEICNNVRQYANMAEADMKGKVSIEPKFVMLTTNVKKLCAHTYSNEPVSIVRRAHLHVTVTVKSEFCTNTFSGGANAQLDSEKVAKYYTDEHGIVNIPLVPDLWDITVERVAPKDGGEGRADAVAFEVYEFEGKKMEKVSIKTYLRLMVELSKKHFEQQRMLIERSNNLAQKFTMCACGMPKEVCSCLDTQVGYVMGAVVGTAVHGVCSRAYASASKIISKELDIIEQTATNKLVSLVEQFECSHYMKWTNWIPHSWLHHAWGKRFVHYAFRDDIIKTIRREVIAMLTLALGIIVFALCSRSKVLFLFSTLITLILIYRTTIIVETVKERVYNEIAQRNDAMPEIFKRVRDNQSRYVLMALGSFGALYTLLKVWQGIRNSMVKSHGNLAPTSYDDIAARDAEKNPWTGNQVEVITALHEQVTRTVDETVNPVFKNLVYMRVRQGSDYRVSGALFLNSGICLMPSHMWHDNGNLTLPAHDELFAEFRRGENDKQVFRAYLSRYHKVIIPKTDLCIVWIPNSGDYKNIHFLLPIDKIRTGPARMVYRDSNGRKVIANAYLNPGIVGHRYAQFMGASYKLSIPTFSGLCMATFLSEGKVPHICGFHLGGRDGTQEGILGTITQDQYSSALGELLNRPGVIIPKSKGNFPKELYGKKFYHGPQVHYKSPVNFIDHSVNMEVLGTVDGKVKPHSQVAETSISKIVEDVTGVPQQWGPPQFTKEPWRPWQESLDFSSNPSPGMEGNLLVAAVEDYSAPLLELLEDDRLRADVRPLTRMETICGRDGVRFIDKMVPKTSAGFPLSGPKSNYMTRLNPEDYPEFSCPIELDQIFWDEFDRAESIYRSGERYYPIFKACLKDEPTKLTKSKVRVFQSAPLVLQLLVRKYYLPIARLLSIYPLLSECAVGINCQGPEWEQFQRHISQYGKDRILAGDYSKYDLRMPAQLMFAAFRVFIDIAVASGNYTEEDLDIMRGIATDICYPLTAYNGTLIQLIGSNPSGQNLTVYINSVVNALLFRCGLYSMYTQREIDQIIGKKGCGFRDVCALGTYGDDAKSSVRKGFDKFNHITFAKFLEDHDMKFTMPDKESTPTEYMSDEDADFLKRKNVFCEDVGMHFGALDEESIFKSLHCTLKSEFLTDKEQAINNIDGALREWFAYGRDHFEMRRRQMQEVASRASLVCRELDVDYDARLEKWRQDYLDTQGGLERGMTESQALDYVASKIPMKEIARNSPMGAKIIGEVDLIFQTTTPSVTAILVVEVKNNQNSSNAHWKRRKAKLQVKRQVLAMEVLCPNNAFLGLIYTPQCGFEPVVLAGNTFNWEALKLPFDVDLFGSP